MTSSSGPSTAKLAVVGDFDPETLLPAITKIFGGWKADRPYARIERPYQTNIERRAHDRTPDKANALLGGGMNLPIGDTHPDYAAARWLATTSWEGEASRLGSPTASARRGASPTAPGRCSWRSRQGRTAPTS